MIECFFFVESEKDDEGTIRALCLNCKMNHMPSNFPAWFYSGEVGPWTIKCHNCNTIIHFYEETENNETSHTS